VVQEQTQEDDWDSARKAAERREARAVGDMMTTGRLYAKY
jgi:hypothetical protein